MTPTSFFLEIFGSGREEVWFWWNRLRCPEWPGQWADFGVSCAPIKRWTWQSFTGELSALFGLEVWRWSHQLGGKKKTLFGITPGAAGYFRVIFNLFRLLFLQEQRSAGRVRKIQNAEYSIFVLSWLESGKCSKKEIDNCLASFLTLSRKNISIIL